MSYQERLLNELLDLTRKSVKLLEFIEECEEDKKIAKSEYFKLLTKQSDIMSEYEYILVKRILFEMQH